MRLPHSLGRLEAGAAVVGAGGAFSPKLAGESGWNRVSVEYDKNDFEYNIDNAGLSIDLGLRW
jgi:hypothetical protein